MCDLVDSQWPFPNPRKPPDQERYIAILADYAPSQSTGAGPAFVALGGQTPSPNAASPVTRANVEVLEPGFSDCIPEIDHIQPCYVVLVDNRAVSLCQTVRRSSQGIEAGVDTLPEHRRKGYAARG